jgi:hypothetical protein
MDVWGKIITEDIFFRPSLDLLGKLNHKTLEYIKSGQTPQGFFHKSSPSIYHTRMYCGILKSLGKRPSQKTIQYIKFLQVGKLGYGETIGDMAWIDKTNLGCQMCRWLGIKPDKSEEMAEFLQGFQNEDGGFGSIRSQDSAFNATCYTISILKGLGYKPLNAEVTKYIQSFQPTNLWMLWHKIRALHELGHNLSDDEKKKLSSLLKAYNPITEREKYNYYASHLLLGLTHTQPNLADEKISTDPIRNYYLARLMALFENHRLDSEFLDYVKSHELPDGGFSFEKPSVIDNGFMVHSLYLLDKMELVQKEALVNWLNNAARESGFGSTQDDEHTVSGLTALRLLKEPVWKNEQISSQAFADISECINCENDDNYFVLRTLKYSIEKLMLLNRHIDALPIQRKVMGFYRNGGFGSRVPYMHATLWAIRSLFLCEKYLKYSGKIHYSHLNKIRKESIEWINSCQNNDGGFGPIPGEPSNLQSTFCALYSLWMLNGRPMNKKSEQWLLRLQKEDGGFGGSISSGSEMLHILYAIGSINILRDF